jgi:hypothetical protein
MSEPARAASAAFAVELVKLLLQVVWADHDVSPGEAEALLGFARRLGLSATELESLSAMLTGHVPLAPPNLGLLKTRRTEVLRSIKLLLTDLHLGDEEEDVLSQIAALLG